MSLPKEVEASYAAIIDAILATSDLNTVSEKRIRKGLQASVEYDITPQKAQIKELIMARFDKFNAEHNSTPSSPPPMPARALTNGRAVKRKSSEPFQEASPPTSGARNGDDEEAMSDVVDSVPKSQTKKRKTMPLDDARYAAKLQAEEYSRLRSTRGGASKKTGPVRKKMRKRVSSQKVKVDGDSDVESGTGAEEKRKVNRSGGFHKPLTLSTPLSEFLGEATLPRTEIVKRIWAYVKERDLQDPNDRRQIRCDDALKSVFKQDRVHMFTMNKLLSGHVFVPDE